MNIVRKSLILFAPFLLLGACNSQNLYSNLSEAQANDMVAVLLDAGIDASKAPGEKEQWQVSVSQNQFARAVEVLKSNGFPRKEYDTLGSVFKKEGFASSPLEERARLNYGMSQELSNSIRNIDGVIEARVHLTMPEPDPLSKEVKPASASVFVKYRPGFNLQSETGAIKSLVTNAVEGLTYDRVSVIMTPSRAIPRVVANDVSIASILNLRIVIILLALILIGFAARMLFRSRKTNSAVIVTGQD
jgi:type III secretion protein J